MGYDLHIRREGTGAEPRPISLTEWIAAVQGVVGVRLATGPLRITNPKTGEVLSFSNNGGDAEIYFAADEMWRRLFLESGGQHSLAPYIRFRRAG